ncbi:cytoplasmic protein, partial [Rozella allomycis CSF55]
MFSPIVSLASKGSNSSFSTSILPKPFRSRIRKLVFIQGERGFAISFVAGNCKSSFFNALTNSAVAAENYPFCTIDPEESRVAVPDARFDWLCDTYKPASKVPAYLTVIDIAGLVKGAASGAGLGNAFLSNIRAVDGIFHVVRAFSEPNVVHVEGEVDPVRDLSIIHEELRLKDEEFLKNKYESLKKGIRGQEKNKEKVFELETVEKVILISINKLLVYKWVSEEKKDVRHGDWNGKEIDIINSLLLLTAKTSHIWLPKIKQWIDENTPGDTLIPFSCSLELLLSQSTPDEKEQYLKELNTTSALPKIIVTGYSSLQLIYFFTAGADEVRAWTIRKGTKAPQAAGVIHTDFERGFIMAEIMKYQDLKDLGSEAQVKAAGKYLQKGKDHVIEDGDIIYFKFNV